MQRRMSARVARRAPPTVAAPAATAPPTAPAEPATPATPATRRLSARGKDRQARAAASRAHAPAVAAPVAGKRRAPAAAPATKRRRVVAPKNRRKSRAPGRDASPPTNAEMKLANLSKTWPEIVTVDVRGGVPQGVKWERGRNWLDRTAASIGVPYKVRVVRA